MAIPLSSKEHLQTLPSKCKFKIFKIFSAKNGHVPSGAKSWLARHQRKDSAGYSESAVLGGGAASQLQQQQKRLRSTSLCAAQLKADCQAIANLSYQHALNPQGGGRKASSSQGGGGHGGVMPPLTRLRIQQCFRNAKWAKHPIHSLA
jgi:hypothetical protein